MSPDQIHEANRKSWNEATKVSRQRFCGTAEVRCSLKRSSYLGTSRDCRCFMLHLQCNSGQDTLSIVSHLSAHVVGVDISDEAIDFARNLSAESGIPAAFHRADVYDWLGQADAQQYDIVFSSYGAISWLSDLKRWAKGINRVLIPGGKFVLVEFHPLPMIYEIDWTLTYDYMGGEMSPNKCGVGDYVAESGGGLTHTDVNIEDVPHFENPHPAYEFCWGLAEIVTALLEAGLRLITFTEYPYSNGWKPFPNMRELPGRRMAPPEGMPVLPFMFGVVARKP